MLKLLSQSKLALAIFVSLGAHAAGIAAYLSLQSPAAPSPSAQLSLSVQTRFPSPTANTQVESLEDEAILSTTAASTHAVAKPSPTANVKQPSALSDQAPAEPSALTETKASEVATVIPTLAEIVPQQPTTETLSEAPTQQPEPTHESLAQQAIEEGQQADSAVADSTQEGIDASKHASERLSAELGHALGHNFNYPLKARRRNMQGEVLLRFSVDKQGVIGAIHIEQSSGHAILDQAAMKNLASLSPLADKPDYLLDISLPIEYRLH